MIGYFGLKLESWCLLFIHGINLSSCARYWPTHTHTHTVAHMDTLSYSIHILSLPIAYTWLQKITCSKSFFLFMGMADAPM